MGLVSTGDEFCRRGDIAIQDLDNVVKVVDDVLTYDDNFEAHVQRVRRLLQRCREQHITLKREKFVFASPEVDYCGFHISSDGVKADSTKARAIRDFPTPTNLTQLRSFMGLVQQLGDFSSDIARTAEPLRDLLKTRNEFCWTPDHDAAFSAVKEALSATPVLAHFDPSLPTVLQTDAARLKGLGYALLQQHGDCWRIIQCGSRFLTDTETRYSVIELELLAAVWALGKCRVYLLGLPHFTLLVDHKPLVPILNDLTLDAVENPRLQRLKEKTSLYTFKTVWRKGKEHAIPDALSRSPVDDPSPDDDSLVQGLEMQVRQMTCARMSSDESTPDHLQDPKLADLKEAALRDSEYQQLLSYVQDGWPRSRQHVDHRLQQLWKVRDDLSAVDGLVLKGPRIFIPASARQRTLDQLHSAHQGVERMKRRARQSVWWPGMDAEVKRIVEACEACQQLRPSQVREPLMTEPLPSRVFEDVSADLFSHGGRQFLVYADRLSGWPIVFAFPRGDTRTTQVIGAVRKAFVDFGVPVRLRSDGGPQFSSHDFRSFLRRWGVRLEQSTPHYPQSNGHAEAAVKAVKMLVMKTCHGGDINSDQFCEGLLELRNTPRSDGRSPAQVVFGHPIRSTLPVSRRSFAPEWQAAAADCDARAAEIQNATESYYNLRSKSLPPLKIGTQVRLQDPVSKKWDRVGTIVGVGNRRDFHVKMPGGAVFWRNRRFLRPTTQRPPIGCSLGDDGSSAERDDTGTGASCAEERPRRHVRFRLPPDDTREAGKRPGSRLRDREHLRSPDRY